ncbi:cryptochrome/photolyase family protein [Zavarzinia compransoris]|uniref:Deoxyribodipyrimidine photo-lyase n=1 Tax=Zavarzinia compransoris TaxID=1264899 RepID=A0A317E8W0_9PROT|nr:deoxyribodipyrimidine photo-lyase [Zavarzinia compransoris]PWR23339.1 deoxyribodipyrimidine photolyase [Zavarzinia compransoris]TDP46087.1 deoxyribodipyrimidine photo-lyase [Zavarzinia compransoris]
MAAPRPHILWFRRDLRLADNPALAQAAAGGQPLIPLYILDDSAGGPLGGAQRWWLHHSLAALDAALRRLGSALVLRRGPAADVLERVAEETGADTVHWNRLYDPAAIARDTALKAALTTRGITVASFNAALLFEPWTIRNQSGRPFKVFTPFWKACLAAPAPDAPLPAPPRLAPASLPAGERLDEWALRPRAPDWAAGFAPCWQPGEAGAGARLGDFLDGAVGRYKAARDRPDLAATSRLSPHLAFGEIGPRQVWHAVHHASGREPAAAPGAAQFLAEIGWREFSYHLLFHQPQMPERPLRAEFAAFPWAADGDGLAAWRRGLTGYPIVDAGMRELWQTGWMHNRVRMIAASFLVKDLLVPWQRGEAWFRETLLDADVASNAASWQWVAGCGADAAPYFRIFNPVLQGEKFDPEGHYIRRFVPELAPLPAAALHRPWAQADLARRCGVTIGRDYPAPIIDHGFARRRALAALATLKQDSAA